MTQKNVKLLQDIAAACSLIDFIEALPVPAFLFSRTRDLIHVNAAGQRLANLLGSPLSGNIIQVGNTTYRRTTHKLVLDHHIFWYETLEKIPESEDRPSSLIQDELETILESVHDGIYVTDGLGFTIRINETYTKLTGITKEEVQGRHVCELVHKGYFDHSVTLEVLRHRAPVSILQKIKEGSMVWLVKGNPVFDADGRIRRVVNTIYDMTELNNLRDSLKSKELSLAATKRQVQILKEQHSHIPGIVAKSYAMRQVVERIRKVAPTDSTVFILGETGCGKTVVARTIHKLSRRADKNFIEINCATIPESLFESELFGYAAGAFTGAHRSGKIGLLEAAHGGTVFLDEIGEMPLNMQVKLLTFLQDRKIRRVGDTKDIEVDVRIIAATHQDPKKLIAENKLREDLFYRLSVVPIVIPSLRERKEDIYALADHVLALNNRRYNRSVRFSKGVYLAFEAYPWPGNVRELEHVVEQLVILAENDVINVEDLPPYMLQPYGRSVRYTNQTLKEILADVEREVIKEVLTEVPDVEAAAKRLGIHRTTLMRKMEKLGLLNHHPKRL